MSDLTINEIKEKKGALEKELAGLIKAFEKETGVYIEYISMDRDVFVGSKTPVLIGLNSEISIK